MNTSEHGLKERHRFSDCLYWNLFFFIPLIIGCVAIANTSVPWVVGYLLLSASVFFVVVYRFFCTHCPHYVEGDSTIKCLFLWGIPKYFKAQPGPYSSLELMATAASVLVWVAFPLFWLYLHPGLLAAYVASIVVLVSTMRRYECGRCIHFDCPGNTVAEDVKARHLQARSREEGG
jgi:hypothetical protein